MSIKKMQLDVGFGFVAVFFHPAPTGCGFAFAHEHLEAFGRFFRRDVSEGDGQQAAGIRIQGRFPELFGIHFAQPLETGDAECIVPDAFAPEFFENAVQFRVIECVQFLDRFLAACRCIDTIQRRAGDIDVAVFDQTGEMTEKQGQ